MVKYTEIGWGLLLRGGIVVGGRDYASKKSPHQRYLPCEFGQLRLQQLMIRYTKEKVTT